MKTVCTGWLDANRNRIHTDTIVMKNDGRADDHLSHGICPACNDILMGDVPVTDDAGRVIAPPQHALYIRPAGPWDANGRL